MSVSDGDGLKGEGHVIVGKGCVCVWRVRPSKEEKARRTRTASNVAYRTISSASDIHLPSGYSEHISEIKSKKYLYKSRVEGEVHNDDLPQAPYCLGACLCHCRGHAGDGQGPNMPIWL